MPQTQLGDSLEAWTASAKAEFKNDLNKLTSLPTDALRTVVDKIAKSYPACNATELALVEAEQRGISNPQDLADVISAWTFLWSRTEGESPQVVVNDLASLGVISDDAGRVLTDLLEAAEPFRETAQTASLYLRVGAPLFVSIRGVLDVRCRFHRTAQEFQSGKLPSELIDAQQVIMANLTLNNPDDEEVVIPFLMDENDLRYLKRFVRNMEREIELSKSLLKSTGANSNG
jgi:hypothetical protein